MCIYTGGSLRDRLWKPIKICIIYLFIILLLLFKYVDIGWSSNIATCNLNTSSHTYICIHQSLVLKDIKLITRVYPSSHIIYIYTSKFVSVL